MGERDRHVLALGGSSHHLLNFETPMPAIGHSNVRLWYGLYRQGRLRSMRVALSGLYLRNELSALLQRRDGRLPDPFAEVLLEWHDQHRLAGQRLSFLAQRQTTKAGVTSLTKGRRAL
jgi:hypothetical protein